ncbi:MAG TPA: BamA/TamA family outer membrane protein [Blastocatellia bacterium]|nr:BamA/TamA family outer membrane protein [Blastocatellia bacterium]
MKSAPAWTSSATLRLVALSFVLTMAGVGARANDLTEFLGRRVVSAKVVIEGAPDTAIGDLDSFLDVSAGQDFSAVRIHDSLVRLHRSGLVSGARVEAEAVRADGVALRFVVKPQSRVGALVFEGDLTAIPPGELKARLSGLESGSKLSEAAIARGVGDLTAFYSSRGYHQANVTAAVRFDPLGTRATVVFTVAPGDQARVARYTLDSRDPLIDLSKVKHALAEDKPFVESAVQDEVDRIRQAYLQEDYLAVRIHSNVAADVLANTVAVTLTVERGPRFVVDVQGIQVSDKKKREIFPFYTQGGIDDFTVEDGRLRLADYAQREGYFFADVARPDLPDLKAGTARLVYSVETGRRYRLSDIEIEGLDTIPHFSLEEQMKSKTAAIVPLFGLGRGVTSNDMLRQDENLIKKRLRDLGYRSAKVETRRGVSLDGDNLIITFGVEQGERSYIDEIDVRGNNILASDELSARFTVKPGDPLAAADVLRTNEQLLAAYTARGYAAADIEPEVVDLGTFEGQDRVRLVFSVDEGARAHIRKVTTVVNSRARPITNTARLERDFYQFKSGGWLELDQLQETERALYETNAFSSVAITSEVVGQSAGGVEERDVTVSLTEAKRYDTIFGFGYQSSKSDLEVPGLGFFNGARVLSQLTYTNFLGRLYTLSGQVRAGQDELLGRVSFQNPRPFSKNYPTLISFFVRRLAEKTFLSDRYTALIQAERRLSLDTIVYVSYNFERISIFKLKGSIEEIERNKQPIRLGRIGPSFARDKRDNAFDPTRGNLTLGSFFIASKALGGNEQFIKFLAEHSRYYAIERLRDTVFSVSGRLGLATPFGGKDTLPISERFFAGGSRDLRGFGFEEAGPIEIVDISGRPTRVPTGGNAVIVVNSELRFPIYKVVGGTVFSDTGNVFGRVRDIKPKNFTETLGFGLRLKTPIGPVRVDLGFLVINKPVGASQGKFHFSVGQTF